MQGRTTIQGIQEYLETKNKSLNDFWELDNANYDKDLLLDCLMLKCSSLEPLYSDPDRMYTYSKVWWRKWRRTFQEWFDAFDIEYNPLDNYDRYEEILDTITDHGLTSGTASGTQSESGESTGTETGTETGTSSKSGTITGTSTESTSTEENSTNSGTSTTNSSTDNTGNDTENTSSTKRDNGTIYENGTNYENGYKNNNNTSHTEGTTTNNETVEDTGNSTKNNTISLTREEKISAYDGISASDYVPSKITTESGYPIETIDSHNIKGTEGNKEDDSTTTVEGEENTSVNGSNEKHSETLSEETITGLKTVISESHEETESNTITNNEGSVESSTTKNGSTSSTSSEESENEVTDSRNVSGTTSRELTDSRTSSGTSSNERTAEHNSHIRGNIGVTTSSAMLKEYLEIRAWNEYDHIIDLFMKELLIRVW